MQLYLGIVTMSKHYSKHGKILQPITWKEFEAALKKLKPIYQAYLVLIYYTGIRVTEALRLRKENFHKDKTNLYVDVGIRLKTIRKNKKTGKLSKGKRTRPLPLALSQPHLDLLLHRIKYTRKGQFIFPFSRTTAWRQIDQAGLGYNHHARLTAITEFLKAGRTVADIVNWFGVSVQTVNDYIGDIDMEEMGAMKRV